MTEEDKKNIEKLLMRFKRTYPLHYMFSCNEIRSARVKTDFSEYSFDSLWFYSILDDDLQNIREELKTKYNIEI